MSEPSLEPISRVSDWSASSPFLLTTVRISSFRVSSPLGFAGVHEIWNENVVLSPEYPVLGTCTVMPWLSFATVPVACEQSLVGFALTGIVPVHWTDVLEPAAGTVTSWVAGSDPLPTAAKARAPPATASRATPSRSQRFRLIGIPPPI